MVFYVVIVLIVAIFIVTPLIWCGVYGCPLLPSSARESELLAGSQVVQGGEGGHETGGLARRRHIRLDCGPGEVYNASMRYCSTNVNFPRALEHAILDESVAACDSFYRHACGKFLQHHAQDNHADRAFSNAWHHNRFETEHIIRDTATGPIFSVYQSCMETVVRGKYAQETAQYQRSAFDAVLQPLKEHGLTSVSVARTMARLIGRGYTAPFSVTAERHPTDAGRWPILLRFAQDAMPQLALENVTALFASGLGLSVQAAAAKARTYLELDAAIRLHAPSQSQSFLQYVGSQTYNQDINNSGRTLEQLSAGNIDLNVFFEELGVHKPHQLWPVWISSPAYFRWLWGTSGPFRGSADSIRTFVEFSMVYHMHAFVPNFGEGHNSFRRRGQQKREDELCLKLTAEMVPAFVAERFARTRPEMEQLRAKVSSMLQQIVAQLRLLVDTTTWLSEDERRVATDKLDGLVVRVAHPNNKDWFDGESIGRELRPDQYIQNVDRVRAYRVQRNLKLWEQYGQTLPLNGHSMSGLEDMNIRDQIARFGVPLSMVNAFYDPTTNTITVPLGILQYPFCDLRFDEASMYASIGSVLGHELAHAFDSTGILFDVHGSYRSGGWWTRRGMDAFAQRAQCVVDEYGQHVPASCASVVDYGTQTLTEDLADLIGFRVSYNAFVASSQNVTVDDQHSFFYAYAQMWCSVSSVQRECQQMQQDVHAIPSMRVDSTLRHTPEFKQAFGCPSRTNMVPKPYDPVCAIYGV